MGWKSVGMELRPEPGVHRHPSTDPFELASSDEVSAQELAELAMSEYPWVVRAVAVNERTPASVLRDLAPRHLRREPDRDLARALLQNPALPADVIGRLVLDLISVLDPHHPDVEFDAVVGVFARSDAPDDQLLEVLTHRSATRHFRSEVAKAAVSPGVRAVLAADRSSRVRDALRRSDRGDG